MIRRVLARLLFRLGTWLDPDHAPAVYGLARARALALPEPTPDELLDDSLAGRSMITDHDCPECGVDDGRGQPGSHHETHCSGYVAPKPEPLQCSIAKGSEYVVEEVARINPLGRLSRVRRYLAPYHVLMNGRLACEPSWEPEVGVAPHPVLRIPDARLCRAPACRALWEREKQLARDGRTREDPYPWP